MIELTTAVGNKLLGHPGRSENLMNCISEPFGHVSVGSCTAFGCKRFSWQLNAMRFKGL